MGSPAVQTAAQELTRLAGEVGAWAGYVARGEAVAGPDECEQLRTLLRALSRAADTVEALATADRDQARTLGPDVRRWGV
jgi:hypothetical protein